jgi:hypothetical protein
LKEDIAIKDKKVGKEDTKKKKKAKDGAVEIVGI